MGAFRQAIVVAEIVASKAWERSGKTENERRAPWERFSKMENERRAPWERVFGLHVPDWSPQEGPPKTFQTFIFKCFWTFLGVPLEHPRSGRQKMDQRKWTPKSSHGDGAKYSFFQQILQIMLFEVH